MTSLGEAVIEVGADTSHFEKDVKRGARKAKYEVLGEESGKKFSKGFNKGSNVSSFSQLNFSFAKIALSATAAASTITPVGPAVTGLAAGVVALGGAAGLASGSLITLGSAVSSLGLAAIVTKVAIGGMGDALKAQSKAQEELAKTGKVSKTTQQELTYSMNQLSPAARQVVKEINNQGTAWGKLRKSIQQNIFKGVAKDIGKVSSAVLPTLRKGLDGTGRLLNKTAKGFGSFVSSREGLSILDSLIGGLNSSLKSLLPSIGYVGKGLFTLFAGTTGEASTLSKSILSISKSFSLWSSGVVNSGKFAIFLGKASQAAGILLRAVGGLGKVLVTIFSAGAGAGVGMLKVFGDATNQLNAFLKSADGQTALAAFFGTIASTAQTARDVFAVLSPVIAGIGTVLTAIQPGIDQLRAALLPVAKLMGDQLGSSLETIAPLAGNLALALANVVNYLAPIAPAILPVVAAFIAWKKVSAALKATQVALRMVQAGLAASTYAQISSSKLASAAYVVQRAKTIALTATQKALTAVFLAYNYATIAVTKSMRLMKLAFATSPVGVIIVGILALVAVLVLAYKKVGWFRAAVNTSFAAIKVAAGAVVGFIVDHWKLLAAIITLPILPIVALALAIYSNFGRIKAVVLTVTNALWIALSATWNLIRTVVVAVVSSIVSAVTTSWNAIGAATRTVFTGILGVITGVWGVITAVVTGAVGLIRSAVSGAFNTIRNIATGAMNGIRNAVSSGIRGVVSLISSLPGRIGGLVGKFLSAGKNLGSSVIKGIGSGLRSAGGFVSDLAGSIKHAINGALHLPFTIHGPGPLPDFTIPAFANGTLNAPGGLSLVGERGPELVRVPGGSRIQPHHTSERLLADAGASPVDLSDDSISKLAAAILAGASRVSSNIVAANNRAQEQAVFS